MTPICRHGAAAAEALERAYPLRVLRYRIREGSGGAGLARGGDGIERDDTLEARQREISDLYRHDRETRERLRDEIDTRKREVEAQLREHCR